MSATVTLKKYNPVVKCRGDAFNFPRELEPRDKSYLGTDQKQVQAMTYSPEC